ncbi:hypothetical protein ACFIOY_13795 [Bradyrhizobium sp. TZ2]
MIDLYRLPARNASQKFSNFTAVTATATFLSREWERAGHAAARPDVYLDGMKRSGV